MSVPELRPLGVGELLDVALKIWRRHFWTLAKVVFVVVAPMEVLSSLLITSVSEEEALFETDFGAGTTDTSFPTFPDPTVDSGDLAAFLAGGLAAAVLSGLGFLLSSAAALRAVSVAYLGGEPDWRESLRLVWGRIGSLLWLALLMGAGLTVALLFLVIPFFWLGVAWSMAFVVLVAEDRGGTGALGRSFQLVRRRWWPTLGTLLLAFILQAIVEQIVSIPLVFLSLTGEGGTIGAFLTLSITSIVSAVITTPFVAAVFVLLYFDLRVRKEGFDVELLASAIGPPAAAASGPSSGAEGGGSPPSSWERPPSSWEPPSPSWESPPPSDEPPTEDPTGPPPGPPR